MQGTTHCVYIDHKSFHPDFLKWTFLSLNLDLSIVANRDISKKNQNRMTNSVDRDEVAQGKKKGVEKVTDLDRKKSLGKKS